MSVFLSFLQQKSSGLGDQRPASSANSIYFPFLFFLICLVFLLQLGLA